MHAHQIIFTPGITIQLTEIELETLRTMSVQHYDHKCRSYSEQGGLIFGFMNLYYEGRPNSDDRVFQETAVTPPIHWREIDTLAKICEGYQFLPIRLCNTGCALSFFFSTALQAMNDTVPDPLHSSDFLPKYAPPAGTPIPS